MGYTTDFDGALKLTPTATEEQRDYINLISGTRRMKRNVSKLMDKYKGKHGNPFAIGNDPEDIYGHEGEYFALDDGQYGQESDGTIIDYNTPPGQIGWQEARHMNFNDMWQENERRNADLECQPGLWCQWIITEDGEELVWNGGEKFYYYVEWLKYLIDRFFEPWEIKLNGKIRWEGEDDRDRGVIVVKDNVVGIQEKKVIRKFSEFDPYGEEDWEEED
jgi:hypothetical protein